MDKTPSLNMPFILPAQAQKHVTHNDALNILDAIVQLSVLSRTHTAPPDSPEPGARYIVANEPTGAWSGNASALAVFQDGAWTFYPPQAGWRCWVQDEAALLIWDGVGWIASATGMADTLSLLGVNATADDINRLTVGSEASLFNHEGAGHQLKINKNSASDTASLLFQTGFSGRAEIATAGTDELSLKVTDTGDTWHEALRATGATGAVSFPNGTRPEMVVPPVTAAGGPDTTYGPPNLVTISADNATLNLATSRMYFAPFYVDRPTELLGGMIIQSAVSSTPGRHIRAGIFALGSPAGDNWNVGGLISDFGTQAADTIGAVLFSAPAPIVVQPGWYLTAVGTNGTGVGMRYAQWLTPGIQHFRTDISGSPNFRVSGPASFLFSNDEFDTITNGFSQDWQSNPVSDAVTNQHHTRQLMIPKWRLWT